MYTLTTVYDNYGQPGSPGTVPMPPPSVTITSIARALKSPLLAAKDHQTVDHPPVLPSWCTWCLPSAPGTCGSPTGFTPSLRPMEASGKIQGTDYLHTLTPKGFSVSLGRSIRAPEASSGLGCLWLTAQWHPSMMLHQGC